MSPSHQPKIEETAGDPPPRRSRPPARDAHKVVVTPDQVLPLPPGKRTPLELVVARYVLLSTVIVAATMVLAGLALAFFGR